MEEYINGTAATLTKPGSDETRPDLTVSFRLERGDQFLIGFQNCCIGLFIMLCPQNLAVQGGDVRMLLTFFARKIYSKSVVKVLNLYQR